MEQTVYDVLSRTELFGGLSLPEVRRVAERHRVRRFPRGTALFLEATEGDAVFVLLSGIVKLYRTTEDGREAVVRMVHPGELFAELILFDERRYPVSASAVVDSEAVEISREHMQQLLQDEHFRNVFVANLIEKLRYLAEQVYVLSSCDVAERLFRFLKERYGRRNRYDLALSKKDIAAAIATVPETLSRTLRRLEAAGDISWHGAALQVTPEAWESYAPE
jgi:CRP/FNR family transcriptional regulator